jgi:hypothetical protein
MSLEFNITSRKNNITKLPEKTSLGTGDFLILEDSLDNFNKKKILGSKFAGSGGGEANTASNVTTTGEGLWKDKVGVDLRFKRIQAASNKVTVVANVNTLNVDIDVVPANIPVASHAINGTEHTGEGDCVTKNVGTGVGTVAAGDDTRFHSNALDHDGGAQDTAIGTKTTLAAVKADTDVADAISKKHANTLDHDGGAQDTVIGTKTTLTAVKADADIADAISKKHSDSLDHAKAHQIDASADHPASSTKGKFVHTNVSTGVVELVDIVDADIPSAIARDSEIGTAVSTHAGLTASVHNFDASGNAPPQAHNQAATTITSGTLDGDRLPALSSTKRGGVPATGTPSGKVLSDGDTWITPGAGGGLSRAAVFFMS